MTATLFKETALLRRTELGNSSGGYSGSINELRRDCRRLSGSKYEERHDQRRKTHMFQIGDMVRLYISKEGMQGPRKKVTP